MTPLTQAVPGTLTLSKIKRGFELRRNGESLGTLTQQGFWGQNYAVTTPELSVMLRRKGWFNFAAEAVDSATQQVIATFSAAWGNPGTLTFADGQPFQVRKQGWWRPVWIVRGEEGQEVLRLQPYERKVEVLNPTSVPERRLALLVLFTIYRIRQAEDDAAAAATTAMVAS